jgi:Sec-independent protein translocase protein TatA
MAQADSVTRSLIQRGRLCDREAGGGYHQRAMHLGDGIFILILALVLLGPKKTSELANQLGKLMAEFRKASNDFKYQFNEEMRVSEQQDRQKKQEAERATLDGAAPPALLAGENTILPPVADAAAPGGVEAETVPYAVSAVSATTGDEHPVEDHPLLRVEVIPPMNGIMNGTSAEVDQIVVAAEVTPSQQADALTREEAGAPVHHG